MWTDKTASVRTHGQSPLPAVRWHRENSVAVVTLDHPPLNVFSHSVRQALVQALRELDADPQVVAAVLIGAGRTFASGSDLREFSAPIQQPDLPAVIAAIESCSKPVVAALHGHALGGGYEVALACDARVCSADAQMGLPEVTLGMIPGAGGTQRLPRLIGLAQAIDVICSGRRVDAYQALALGMVDAVFDGDLQQGAIAQALRCAPFKRRLRDLAVPPDDEAAITRQEEAALLAGRQRPNVWAAIEAVRLSRSLPVDAALDHERRVFLTLRDGADARALRYQFFARRSLSKGPARSAPARTVQRVGVAGGGAMGSGIAVAALAAGCDVTVYDLDAAALGSARQRVRTLLAPSDARAGKARADRLRFTTRLSDLKDRELVIETVVEDYDAKAALFIALDRQLPRDCILATNTSYLDIDALAAVTSRAQRVCGLHFFHPAHDAPLVEVIRSSATSPETLAASAALAQRMGKLAVFAGNAFGFIGNRLHAAFQRQCEFMLEDGAYPEDVDAALEAFGFAIGPFAAADRAGLDAARKTRQAHAGQHDSRVRQVDIAERLHGAGRSGATSGRGYYRWDADGCHRKPDAEVRALIDAMRLAAGRERRVMPAAEIVQRAVVGMVNEAACTLEDGVAFGGADIDIVMVNGYGFPAWEGGPAYWAAQQDARWLDDRLQDLGRINGFGWRKGNVALLAQPQAGLQFL